MTAVDAVAVLGSLLLWTNVYLLLCALFRPLGSPEWTCRIVTSLHAVLLSGLGLASMFFVGPWPFHYLGQLNTELHTDTVVLSLGYFLFDFAWCVRMQTEGWVMLLHHVVSVFGFGYVLYSGRYGCEITCVLGASELTNPLLQLRWFLKHSDMYSGVVERAVDWTFACLFCSIRLGAGSMFFFTFFFSPHVDTIARLGGTGFYVISIVFSFQIALYVYHKYCNKKSKAHVEN